MPLLSIPQVLAIWLAAAIALSVPVVGWCAAARHQGQGLHALFAHVHTVTTLEEHLALDHETIAPHVHEEAGTNWSTSTVLGAAGPVDGIQAMAPALTPTIISDGQSPLFLRVVRPISFIPGPVVPPPRLTA